jgi:hypothetical protein
MEINAEFWSAIGGSREYAGFPLNLPRIPAKVIMGDPQKLVSGCGDWEYCGSSTIDVSSASCRTAGKMGIVGTCHGSILTVANEKAFKPHTQRGKPCAFGDLVHGCTRVDTDVRCAEEFSHECFPGLRVMLDLGCGECNPDRDEDYLADFVRRELFPGVDTGGSVCKLRFYKIVVYREGGHFVDHMDTPRPGVLATVVLIRDDEPFKGGDLVVKYGSQTMKLTGEPSLYPKGLHSTVLKFAAFLPNLVHEVTPVIEGVRTCYIYDLVAEPLEKFKPISEGMRTWSAPSHIGVKGVLCDPKERQDAYLAQVQRMIDLHVKGSVQDVHALAIPTQNPYSYAELVAFSESGDSLAHLKGVDALLVDVMRANGFVPQNELVPVILQVLVTVSEEEGSETSFKMYRMTRADMLRARGAKHGPDPEWIDLVGGWGNMVVLVPADAACEASSTVPLPDGRYETGQPYAGNESWPDQADNFYWQCLLVALSQKTSRAHPLLRKLADTMQHLHCTPPMDRAPGTRPFQIFFELRNGYKCRLVADMAEATWKAEVCCGEKGVTDVLERTDAWFDIECFLKTMTSEQFTAFKAPSGVYRCGTSFEEEDGVPSVPTPEFTALETKVLGKIVAAAETYLKKE